MQGIMYLFSRQVTTAWIKNATILNGNKVRQFHGGIYYTTALANRYTGCKCCRFNRIKSDLFSDHLLGKNTFTIYGNIRLKATVKNSESHIDLDKLFPLRYLYVRTSISAWEEYPEGVQFDVAYVDTKLMKSANAASKVPVILALPSSVGSHVELAGVLLTFVKLGYRVLIPNLPGSALCRGRAKTDEAIFRMSIEEKADFVKDFLSELQIDKVDMLVTSACSVYTGVHLCMFHGDLVKSLVMLNPTGLQPTRSMTPVWLHTKFSKIYDDRFVLQGIFSAMVGLVKMFTKKRQWETCNIVTYSRTISSLSFADVKVTAGYLTVASLPRIAIYGNNSDYLDVQSTEEYLSCIGIPDSAITVIDQQNNLVKKGEPKNGNFGVHINGDFTENNMMFIRKQLLDFLKSVYPGL